MRKHFLLLVLIIALVAVLGASRSVRAAPTDLFFSEYIEGSSFNKAIEIYNGTGSAVDLAAGLYTLELYSNGAATPSQSVALTGAIADGDVFIAAHGSANATILAVADLTSSSVINFNGDDAVVLRKNGAVVDAFGQIGVDPGSEWPGGGLNDTLRRAETVCAGDTNAADAFDASIEWIVFATDDFDGLGSHTAGCNGGGANDPLINEFVFNHTGTDTNEYVEIFGDPNTDYSAFTILQLEGDGTPAGVIDAVLPVGTTDAGGFWTTGFLNNTFENGTVTLLLVEGFSGSQGDDLDSNNDGALDIMPWTRLVDDVAVSDGGAGDGAYAGTVLAPGFGGSPFTPGGASRIPNGADSDSVADWSLNDFDNAGIPGFPGTPDPGEALNTPGAVNALVPVGPATGVIINEVDSDTDGVDALEFVELYDGGSGNTALDGLVVVFYNGSNNLSYAAFDLDGHSTDANGYFLLGNAAVSPTPSIVFSDNTLQNGADAVALYSGSAGDFPNGTAVTTNNLIDAIVYDTADADDPELLILLNAGQPQVNESGAGNSAGDSNQRCPNGEGGARNTDTYTQATPSPGVANPCGGDGGEIGSCGDPATFIHEVQGNGDTSPLDGTGVIIEGVVVGDFQNNAEADDGDLNGFYVQEEEADADSDPETSEGIFVFAPAAADVSTGDHVRVLGEVDEFGSSGSLMTELTNVTVLICAEGVALPAATAVTLPVTDVSDFEHYEGMLVTFPQDLVISEFFNFDRFNEIVLTAERQHQPTAVAEPGPAAAAIAEANALSRITLDDGRTPQNPDPAIHPNGNVFDLSNRFRGGDLVSNATGVMDDSFGLYRIQPTEGADYTPQNPRPAAPEDVGGSLTVASFNVLNYFLTLDDGVNDICGPAQNQECRGADDQEEFERQRAKILSALAAINADVFGLIEMENTTGVEPLQDIVNGLNDQLGAGTYDFIDTGTIGGDAIRVGIIYKPGTVTPVGDYAILDSSVDPRFDDTRSRPVLAQTFMENASGGVFTVAVNHLKSKGSDCGGPPDDDPQQGNCNGTRTLAAEAQVDWLAGDPTGSGDADFLIIGDLNAYDKEDPIDAIREGADDALGTGDDYTDLIFQYQGEFAYSYLFDGQLGYLDHALAVENLVPQVTGATVWHINADEPDILDYDTSFKQDAQDDLFEPNAYRSSDHDPVIVGLDLNSAPNCANASPSQDSLWPPNHNFVSITVQGVTDPDGDPITITIDSIFQDEAVDAPGSGNTAPDGQGVGTATAEVRSERAGGGNGRVYHITFSASDGQGGVCTGEVLVGVPKSRGSGPAVDDGALFDSTVVP